jgi:DNA polymerase-3 subunit epsilon
MSLIDLQILALDCQSTGANPVKGHLLEVGWVKTSAAATCIRTALAVQSYLIQLPQEIEIPKAVKRVTGISQETLRAAMTADKVWRKLVKTANKIAAANHTDLCPTVIHFSRFEEPFLRDLYSHNDSRNEFPFQIICTHEITKRLLPGLPRRGLRAVAGYFGHSVPPYRRSADHAIATAVIWQKLIQQLTTDWDVKNLDQLQDWLKCTTPATATGRVYPMNRDIRLSLPDKPGIYRMLRCNGDLLYIGKAKSLKHRVNSYFRQKGTSSEHTMEMLSQAANLDVTLTHSALEAAVLESDEIKRHSPPYNVALQRGERKIVFCSKDLQKHALKADKIHCIGPLPGGKLIASISAFGVWDSYGMPKLNSDHIRWGYAILNLPEKYAPEADCLSEGFAVFCQTHRDQFNHSNPLRMLTKLGRKLWHETLVHIESKEENQEEDTENQLNWTPQKVAKAIENCVMRSALLIRRSRWLCLLSEASLAWEARHSVDHQKNLLLFENGDIMQRMKLCVDKQTPVPRGYAKGFQTRQKQFNLKTYERLRVVTTELRRIGSEGRAIELRLGPRAILGLQDISKVLQWV